MNWLHAVGCLLFGGVITLLASGQECRRVPCLPVVQQVYSPPAVYYPPTVKAVVHQATVVEKVAPVYNAVITQFVAVPLPVFPVFGIGYGQDPEVRALREELFQLRRALYTPPAVVSGPAQVPGLPTGQHVPPMPPVGQSGQYGQSIESAPQRAQQGQPGTTGARVVNIGQVPGLQAGIQKDCISCHGASPKGNKFSLAAGQLTREQALDCYWRVSSGDPAITMPKGGPPADDTTLKAFNDLVATFK